MSDIFKKLGINVGSPTSLIAEQSDTNVVEKSEILGEQSGRMGAQNSSRDMLEAQLSKGMISPYASEAKNEVSKGRPEAEALKDTSGDQFHTDADKKVKKLQETVEEIHLDGAEKSGSAEQRDLGNNGDDLERSLVEEGDLFLKAMAEPCMKKKSQKIAKDDGESPPPPTINSQIGSPFGKGKKDDQSLITVVKEKTKPSLIKDLHENSPGIAEKRRPAQMEGCKSELDQLVDLVKSAPVSQKDTVVSPQHTAPKARPTAKQGFIKSAGKGGLLFDFGDKTGNPMADRATELLNAHGDPQQLGIASYQKGSYDQAIANYVEKGEAEFSKDATPFGNIQKGTDLSGSFDAQVKAAFDAGQFDSKGPAIKNQFNATELTLGGEVIKATSETDAALIEMMKAEQARLGGSEDGVTVDASFGGAIPVTAGEPIPELE